MLTDVSSRVCDLQEPDYALFRRDAKGVVSGDPNRLIPGDGIIAANWHVLDASQPDGLDLRFVRYADIKLDKNKEAGGFLALERKDSRTKLFFVWVPSTILSDLARSAMPNGFHFHLLYHPPTWESCYRNTPYWDGVCPRWTPEVPAEKDVCVPDMDKRPIYVRLGLRYGSQYSFAVPQHLIALTGKQPRTIYVAPVATSDNFSDLVTPSSILSLLQEITDYLVDNYFRGGRQAGLVGEVMLSGYSRSGTRLTELFQDLYSGRDFFARHLMQVNAFDINLGDTQREREAKFNPLWNAIFRWKSTLNKNARACIYTAYPYHASYVLNNSLRSFLPPTTVDLDGVKWSDESLRKVPGNPRGSGLEAYTGDATLTLLHLPPSFARVYLGPVANDRGWLPNPGGNGHNWFLRALMSHALAHGDPAGFGAPRS